MVVKRQHLTHLVGFSGWRSEGGADSMFFIHLFPNWSCHNFFYGGHSEFSSCQEFFSSRSGYICTVLPEMKAVISADIILEPRNTVIYYSPLIKAAISLSVPLLSSLPLKASPPPSPSFTHLSLHTVSHALVNFLHDPSYMPFFFCPSLLFCCFHLHFYCPFLLLSSSPHLFSSACLV